MHMHSGHVDVRGNRLGLDRRFNPILSGNCDEGSCG